MRKHMAAVLAVILLCGCSSEKVTEDTEETEPTPSPSASVNPYTVYGTLALAEEDAGFRFVLPSLEGAEETVYRYDGADSVLEVIADYPENLEVIYRKGKGERDLSFSEDSYDMVEEGEINGHAYYLKGDGETVSLAIWAYKGYSYAIVINQGMPEKEVRAMIQNML